MKITPDNLDSYNTALTEVKEKNRSFIIHGISSSIAIVFSLAFIILLFYRIYALSNNFNTSSFTFKWLLEVLQSYQPFDTSWINNIPTDINGQFGPWQFSVPMPSFIINVFKPIYYFVSYLANAVKFFIYFIDKFVVVLY